MISISVVVPVFNEEESLPELTQWIHRVMQEHEFSYEVLLINDGSTDRSWEVIQSLASKNEALKGINFTRNYGKSAALDAGFKRCSGEVVITMDADLQDSPDEIPGLYTMIKGGLDVVSGWKKERHDPISKTIPSKFFNGVTRWISGIQLNDFNCGLKAYRNKVVKNIHIYGEMHRYIPVLAKWAGYSKIGEKEVEHRARKYGISKFGWERFINGFLDLTTIMFIGKFGKKPMHLFGMAGTLMFLIGFALTAYLGLEKLFYLSAKIKAPLITDRPWFYLALVAMIIGVQLFLAGFLGELLSRSSSDRNHYLEHPRLQ